LNRENAIYSHIQLDPIIQRNASYATLKSFTDKAFQCVRIEQQLEFVCLFTPDEIAAQVLAFFRVPV